MSRVGSALAAGALFLIPVGCGGGDDGDLEAYCEALDDLGDEVADGAAASEEGIDDLEDLLDDLALAADAEQADAVADVQDEVDGAEPSDAEDVAGEIEQELEGSAEDDCDLDEFDELTELAAEAVGDDADDADDADAEAVAIPPGATAFDASDSLTFDPVEATATATADGVVLGLRNEGSLPHTLVIEDHEDELRLSVSGSDDVDSGTIDLPAGTYTYYCDVAGHRSGGMEGTLTVEG